jgi:hypothetical protein
MKLFSVLLLCFATACSAAVAEKTPYDLVVYGGTAGGAAAAIQGARMGGRVVLIEPGRHIGGLTSGGLGATDIGNKAAIGGISREFYRRVKAYYADPAMWTREKAETYRSFVHSDGDDAMWTFEPHVAEKILRGMLEEAGVEVVLGERLERKEGVVGGIAQTGPVSIPDGQLPPVVPRIWSLLMESGRRIAGACFIDATYEGDLMAAAGVKYHVGREDNSVYGETLNGVQVQQAKNHQFVDGVNPYVKPGDPASGLLPGVQGEPLPPDGTGDARVQTYNLRMCLTDDRENRIVFEKPDGYDEFRYELLFRNFEAGETRVPWNPKAMPNRKTDVNNNYGFSTDYIGMNYAWPEADYATREGIYKDHLLYQRGLMWTLANHPRVPESIRAEVSQWGNCRDEFSEHGGWSHQLYVREARRMVSEYVMTQNNCQGRAVAEDPVGLAAYTMDSHHVQRYVDPQGQVKNEGDVQVGKFPPYPISYRSIRPTRQEWGNLLVPVCLSASHIAYGSIRMEPVFMVLGQSAATAAILAMEAGVPVQDLDMAKLRARLEADGQVLAWRPAQDASK